MASKYTAEEFKIATEHARMPATIPPPALPSLPPVLSRNPTADLDAIARLLRAGDVDTARSIAERWAKWAPPCPVTG